MNVATHDFPNFVLADSRKGQLDDHQVTQQVFD